MGKLKEVIKKLFSSGKKGNEPKVRRGLFTTTQHKKLAKKADEKNKSQGIKEALDGPTFLASIWLLDDLVLDKLPDNVKTKLYPVIDMIMANIE